MIELETSLKFKQSFYLQNQYFIESKDQFQNHQKDVFLRTKSFNDRWYHTKLLYSI